MLSAHLLPNSLISPALAHQPSLLQNKLALATLIYFAPSCFPTVPTPEGMALTWPPPRRFALTPEAHGFLSQLPIAPPPPSAPAAHSPGGAGTLLPLPAPATHAPVHSAPDLPLWLAAQGPGSRSRGCQVLEA